jgi:hypothetical protein
MALELIYVVDFLEGKGEISQILNFVMLAAGLLNDNFKYCGYQ